MSHEVENMMYLNETPWHSLGQRLDHPPTVEEAIKAAGLDWEVKLQPLHVKVEGEEMRVPGFATMRDTDRKVLGVVGPTYRPIQNIDAFRFFQPFLDAGEATIETAGSLRGGRRIWVLARINVDPIEIVPGDAVVSYMLLSNGHTGTLSARCGFTPVRVVCANTMAQAHSDEASKLIRVRHTKNALMGLDELRATMDLGRREFIATTDTLRGLARRNIRVEDLKKYVRTVFEPKVTIVNPESEEADEKADRLLGKIIPLFEKGRGNDLPGVAGTYWAAYNSVSEYLGWERGNRADIRLDSLWYGQNAALNQRALDVALEMAFG